MAQVDQIQIGTTTYDILQSEDAIFTGVSNDSADNEATSWSSVEKLASSETNGSIFTKISSMFKNIRYLYKIIGDLDIGSIGYGSIGEAITDLKDNKSDKDHTHDTSTLKASDGTDLISNTQISDSTHVPSSLLVKQMNDTLTNLVTSVNNKADVNHTHNLATTSSKGFMPSLNGDSTKCLLGNGSWGAAGGTYSTFTSSAAGLAPAAKSGSTSYLTSGYVLTGAGWKPGDKYNTDTNTTYAQFTSAAAGLAPAAKNGTTSYLTSAYVLTGAGWKPGDKYNTDTNTTYAQFTSAAAGLAPAAKNGTTSYLTSAYVLTGAGWKPGDKYNTDTNTTYAVATTAANGLMTAADKIKLNSIAASANKYSLPAASSSALGGIKASYSNGTLTLSV